MASKYLKKGSCSAACETTGNMWIKTFTAFENVKIDIKLANTFKMAIISKTAKKTDKVDAEKIARVLKMEMIPECYVPSLDIRGLRSMVRQRTKLAQDRTRIINRIHNILDKHTITIDATNLFAEKAMIILESAKLTPKHEEIVLQQLTRQLRTLTNELEIQLDKEAYHNDDAKLIASLTGVGTYTALLVAVEIADITRFETPKQLVSWSGLCPTIHQSGDKTYLRKIKKIDRNDLVNWVMIEAASIAAIYDERMQVVYEKAKTRHAGKHGPAVVLVAKKMITIIWHMLTTRTPYQSHNERLYKKKLAKLNKAHNL